MSAPTETPAASATAAPAPVENSEPISASLPAPLTEEGVKVYAGNLSYKSTSDDLKALFEPVGGEILSCEVVFRGKRSSGYGFVAYKTNEDAEKAVEALNKREIDGREMQVEIARPPQPKERKPRVRKPRTAGAAAGRAPRAEDAVDGEEEGAAAVEGEAAGEAVKPKKKAPRKRTKKVAAEGADNEVAAEGAEGVTAAPKTKAPKKKAPVTRIDDESGEAVEKPAKAPRAPRAPREPPTGEPSATLVFVASLPFTMDDDALKALFEENGVKVTSSRIVKRPFGVRRSKGFGFVDTADNEEQKKALALDGKDLDGRAIAVKVALQHQRDPAESLEAVANAAEQGAVPA